MGVADWKHIAMERAYQWRKPAWLVLDTLVGLRVLLGAHAQYVESEPNRYYVLGIVQPSGEWE